MSKRSAMLAGSIRSLIAPVLRDCPPECGMVSITSLDLSPDGSYATVYVSALREPEAALEYLTGQTMPLQRRLSDLHTKKIPRLRFRLDKREEHGNRLDDLLRKLGT